MKERKTYYALLTGEHQSLAFGELRAILDVEAQFYRILASLEGIAVFESIIASVPRIVERSAWVREIGLLVGAGEASRQGLSNALAGLPVLLEKLGYLGSDIIVRVEVSRFKGYSRHSLPREEALSLALDHLRKNRVKASPRGRTVLRIHITEGAVIAGLVLHSAVPGRFKGRFPRERPFFKPGPLSPQLSRVMVNLSRLGKGDTFLDPFCGTGGFCLEACLIGASRLVCLDIDPLMASGAWDNLSWYGCKALVLRGDATALPLGPDSIDSLSTDPPYGRSTTTGGRSYGDLVGSFLSGIVDSVRRGSYIVFAGPYKERPHLIAEEVGLRVAERYQMYVHSTLTREVVVAVRP